MFWRDPESLAESQPRPPLPLIAPTEGVPTSPLPRTPQWPWRAPGPGRQRSSQTGARAGPAGAGVGTGLRSALMGAPTLLFPLPPPRSQSPCSSRDSVPPPLLHPTSQVPESHSGDLALPPPSGGHWPEFLLTRSPWVMQKRQRGCRPAGGGSPLPVHTTLPRKMVLPLARAQVGGPLTWPQSSDVQVLQDHA